MEKKTLKRILKLAIVLFIVESTLQVTDFVVYRYRRHGEYLNNKYFVNWYYEDKSNQWWRNESVHIYSVYHPFLGFIFRNIHTSNINFNELGVRKTLNNPTSGNYPKIFFFGGSTMAGHGVKDEETIPSQVASKLNSPLPQYELYNFGQFAYNSNQELIDLFLQLKAGNVPDVAIFYDGCNDLFTARNSTPDNLNDVANQTKYATRMGKMDNFFQTTTQNNSLINKNELRNITNFATTYIKIVNYPLRLISYINGFYHKEKADTNLVNPKNNEIVISNIMNNYFNNTRTIDALSNQYKFKYVLLWQPLSFNKKLTRQEISGIPNEPYLDVLDASAENILKNRSINNFYDISGIFENYSDKSLFIDVCHITSEGNGIIADYIANLVLSKNSH